MTMSEQRDQDHRDNDDIDVADADDEDGDEGDAGNEVGRCNDRGGRQVGGECRQTCRLLLVKLTHLSTAPWHGTLLHSTVKAYHSPSWYCLAQHHTGPALSCLLFLPLHITMDQYSFAHLLVLPCKLFCTALLLLWPTPLLAKPPAVAKFLMYASSSPSWQSPASLWW